MEPLVIGGLLLMAFSILMAFSLWLSDDSSQQRYAIKGLAVGMFAVGAFNVGSWFVGVLFANSTTPDVEMFGGWFFAVPLALVFLFAFSNWRKKVRPQSLQFFGQRYTDSTCKLEEMRDGFKKRSG